MGAMKSYLVEARSLVENHPNWSMDSLVSHFSKTMKCDIGTSIYFIEKAMEDVMIADAYAGDDYDGI